MSVAVRGPAPERRLLAACLQAGHPAPGALVVEGVDWAALLAMAAAQYVDQAIWPALEEAGIAGVVPQAVAEPLREAHQNGCAANAQLLHELARVQALLQEAGIRSLALKGAALVPACYRSIGARLIGDIDLLVHPARLQESAALLARAGLCEPERLLPSLDGVVGAPHGRMPWADHLPPLATWGGVLLELHDRAPGGGPEPEVLLARSRRLEWQGRSLRIPAPVDLAGMACLHTLIHHRFDWRLRARLVADLWALEAAEPIDWGAVRAAYGAGEGAAALEESQALLAAARAEAAGAGRAPRRLQLLEPSRGGLAVVGRLGHQAAWMRMVAAERGLAALARTFFPSRHYMEARFGLRSGSPLVWLAYPWRLLRGVGRQLWPRGPR